MPTLSFALRGTEDAIGEGISAATSTGSSGANSGTVLIGNEPVACTHLASKAAAPSGS